MKAKADFFPLTLPQSRHRADTPGVAVHLQGQVGTSNHSVMNQQMGGSGLLSFMDWFQHGILTTQWHRSSYPQACSSDIGNLSIQGRQHSTDLGTAHSFRIISNGVFHSLVTKQRSQESHTSSLVSNGNLAEKLGKIIMPGLLRKHGPTLPQNKCARRLCTGECLTLTAGRDNSHVHRESICCFGTRQRCWT